MRVTFLSVQNKYPATRFLCQDFDQKMNIGDQKVQVADVIKRYISGNIWYHLTWLMMLDIIMRVTFLPVQNKYPATRFICQDFDKKWIVVSKRYK